MPINLSNLDYLLETEYSSLERKIKDYEAEYKRILEARKKEFKNSPSFFGWHAWNEKDFPYSASNKLAAKQIYYIDKGEVGIRTEEFSLPVTHSTEVEKVEIFSSAKIPCGCWEGVRKNIAEENGLMVGDNKFYANVDYLKNITSRKKSVKFASSLFDIIIDVKNAKERLEAGKGKEYTAMEALKNYKEEFDRIVKEQKKEFDSLPPNWKPKFNEKNFNYRNVLKIKQTYIINSGEATLETAEFPLPVSSETVVNSIGVYSDAEISGFDKTWEDIRKKIAERNNLVIDGRDKFYKKIYSAKDLMLEIFNVRKAGIMLKNSKKNEAERILALGCVADETLRPLVVK